MGRLSFSATHMGTALAWGVALLATAPAAWAEPVDTGSEVRAWFEVGAGGVANGNGRFGEYARLYQTSGPMAVGNLGLDWRDGEDRYRFANLEAVSEVDFLGLIARHGRQGDYRIGFEYRQIEAATRGDVRTVFPRPGRAHRLPARYTGPATAEPLPAHLGVKRDRFFVDMLRQLGPWELAAEFGSELKDGGRLTAASERFGDATLLLEPVDYRHDTVDLRASHEGEGWLVNAGWYYSRFRNEEPSLTFANAINLDALPRTIDLPPDNRFAQYRLDGLYSFAPQYHLSWFASYGDGRQNDPWLQAVAAPGAVLIDSLDARRVDTDLRLALRGQPTPRFGYRLDWQYRDRDNRTDVIELSPTSFSNVYDLTRQRWSAQAHYRLPQRMRLRGGLVVTQIDRTTRSGERFRDSADDTRVWVELRMPPLGQLNWSVAVETSERDSDLSPQRTAAVHVESPSQALPEYLIPGRNWQYRLQGDMPLTEHIMLGGAYRYAKDDYDNDFFGLHSRHSDELSLDLAWQLRDDMAMGAYGLYQDYRLSQTGFEFNPTFAPTHANAPWRINTADTSYTAGVNLEWQVRPTLDWRVDLSHSENDSSYRSRWLEDTDTGELAGTRDALPGWGVDVQRLESSLDWQHTARTHWQLRYVYERYRSDDWAWQREDITRHGFSWTSPTHDSHAVLLTVRYRLLDF